MKWLKTAELSRFQLYDTKIVADHFPAARLVGSVAQAFRLHETPHAGAPPLGHRGGPHLEPRTELPRRPVSNQTVTQE
ncbi:MAG: hypothetical protein JXB23_13130 [Candidatus Aminicenantes bacterium]|nr:hypothetical protein [Candidatus Aminicenantes bacterium]